MDKVQVHVRLPSHFTAKMVDPLHQERYLLVNLGGTQVPRGTVVTGSFRSKITDYWYEYPLECVHTAVLASSVK